MMQCLTHLVLFSVLTIGSHAAIFAQDKLNEKVKPCRGHWIYFEVDNCNNKDELLPRVVSSDGLTKLEPTKAFPHSICVHQGAYYGHAYLFGDGTKEDGSNAQNVTYWFEEYGNRFHMAALMQREDDTLGHAGKGSYLLSPAQLTSGVFTSTPRSEQPLSYHYDASHIVTGHDSEEALRLTTEKVPNNLFGNDCLEHHCKRKQPRIIPDPCLYTGHWVQFDTIRCNNVLDLKPVILGDDGKTRIQAAIGQTRICVQPMAFSGRAFLASLSHPEWEDTSIQFVNFSFPEYTDDKDVNKASYVRSESGEDGKADLHTAAPFASGKFWSTPDNVAPLDEDSLPGYTVDGTKYYDTLELSWCRDDGEGSEV